MAFWKPTCVYVVVYGCWGWEWDWEVRRVWRVKASPPLTHTTSAKPHMQMPTTMPMIACVRTWTTAWSACDMLPAKKHMSEKGKTWSWNPSCLEWGMKGSRLAFMCDVKNLVLGV